jgi:hypothetical protein
MRDELVGTERGRVSICGDCRAPDENDKIGMDARDAAPSRHGERG